MRSFPCRAVQRRHPLAVTLALGLVALSCPAYSQASAPAPAPDTAADLASLSLERLLDLEIASASHFPQTARQAPAAVQVISRSEIQAHGWRTLAEALATLPGVYTSYDRSYQLLGARGLLHPGDYASRFLLLIDGQRSNEPVYGQAAVGTDAVIDMDAIERIEFVPGPGSAMFGSNAYLGVINVVTLRAGDSQANRSSLELGAAGTRDVVISHTWEAQGGADLLAAFSSRRTLGRDLYFPEFDDGAADGVASGLDHDRTQRLLLKASRAGLQLSLQHMRRTKGIPTASFEQTFNAAGAFVFDERTALEVSMGRQLSPELALAGDLTIGHHRYTGDYKYGADPILTNRDITSASWIGTEWKLMSTAWQGHRLAFGTELHFDARLDQRNFDVEPYALLGEDRRTAYRAALFVDDEISVGQHVQLNLGFRLDHDSELGSRLSPRLAMLVHPGDQTSLKMIVGEAFRAPNPYERHYGGEDVGQLPNPDLAAETIRTAELVMGHQFLAGPTLSASVFRYRLSGLISHVEDDDGLLVFENFDSATSQGFELGLDQRWEAGATMRTSWSRASVRTSMPGDGTWNSPRDMVKFVATLPVWQQRLVLALDARHVGKRFTRADRLASYQRIDLSATWRFDPTPLELRLSVDNVLDTRYADPTSVDHLQDSIVQDGRTSRIRLSYRY